VGKSVKSGCLRTGREQAENGHSAGSEKVRTLAPKAAAFSDPRPLSKWRRTGGQGVGENTELSRLKKSEKVGTLDLGTARFVTLSSVAPSCSACMRSPKAASASEQAQNRRKTGGQGASDRAADSIARFGTLLLRVRALAVRADASEQAWNRR
jgi:hypothetical protein